MKKMYTCAVVALLLGVSLSAHAQDQARTAPAPTPEEAGPAMAKMFGGMELVARTCGLQTDAQLASTKAQHQQRMATQNALSAADFERHHTQGIAEARARLEPQSAEQRATMCRQVKEFETPRQAAPAR